MDLKTLKKGLLIMFCFLCGFGAATWLHWDKMKGPKVPVPEPVNPQVAEAPILLKDSVRLYRVYDPETFMLCYVSKYGGVDCIPANDLPLTADFRDREGGI